MIHFVSIWKNKGREIFDKTAHEQGKRITPIQPNMVKKRMVVKI